MTLIELNPKLASAGILVFDCPTCGAHRIRVPLAPNKDQNGNSWGSGGVFPETFTVRPSIDAGCWHGSIIKGQVSQ